jgi:hypothetical protein
MVVLGKMLKKIVRSRRERIFEEDWREGVRWYLVGC